MVRGTTYSIAVEFLVKIRSRVSWRRKTGEKERRLVLYKISGMFIGKFELNPSRRPIWESG